MFVTFLTAALLGTVSHAPGGSEALDNAGQLPAGVPAWLAAKRERRIASEEAAEAPTDDAGASLASVAARTDDEAP